MERTYIEDTTFEKIDYTERALVSATYESCHFVNCNFSNTNLSGIQFSECVFTGCNLSMAKLGKTAFRDVTFKACKLLGLHFHDCDAFLFAVYFEHCILNVSSFYKVKLKKTIFKNTSLQEADFTEADLSEAVLDNCDLTNAVFDNSILEKADLRTAYNYSIDPARNSIKKAKFSVTGIAGLLDNYDIEIT